MKSLPYRGMEYVALGLSGGGFASGMVYSLTGSFDHDAVRMVTGALTGIVSAGFMKYWSDRINEPSRKEKMEAIEAMQESMRSIEALVELSRQNMARLERIALGNLKN